MGGDKNYLMNELAEFHTPEDGTGKNHEKYVCFWSK